MPASELDVITDKTPKNTFQSPHQSAKQKVRQGSAGNSEDAAAAGQKKLVPPPPIIGPDGKEIPRPKDAAGRPLPIYVNEDRKPVLDDDGKPIPLRFDKEGKPIPLDVLQGKEAKGTKRQQERMSQEEAVVVAARNKPVKKLPDWVTWVGAVDVVIGLLVGLSYVYVITQEDEKSGTVSKHLYVTTAVLLVGALTGAVPICAVKMNKAKLVWMWACIVLLLAIIQMGVCISAGNILKHSIVGALVYHCIRLFVALCSACALSTEDDSSTSRYYSAGQSRGYPRVVNAGSPRTVVVHQPGVVPYYGGYYGGYPGYYGGTADAALLGFAAGSMLGGGFGYGGGWDYYDDYGGGFGGGFGFDDYGGGFGYDGW